MKKLLLLSAFFYCTAHSMNSSGSSSSTSSSSFTYQSSNNYQSSSSSLINFSFSISPSNSDWNQKLNRMGIDCPIEPKQHHNTINALNPTDPRERLGYPHLPFELAQDLLSKLRNFVPKDSRIPLRKPDMSKDPKMGIIKTAYAACDFNTLLHYLQNESRYLNDSGRLNSLLNRGEQYERSRYLSFLMKIFSDPTIKKLYEIYKAQGLDSAAATYEAFMHDLNVLHQTNKLDGAKKTKIEHTAKNILTNRSDYQEQSYQQYLQSKQQQHVPAQSVHVQQPEPAKETVTEDHLSYIQEMNQLAKEVATIVNSNRTDAPSLETNALEDLRMRCLTDQTSYAPATIPFIQDMEKKELMKISDGDAWQKTLQEGIASFLHSVTPNNPLQNPKEAMLSAVKYAAWAGFHLITKGRLLKAEQAILVGSQVCDLCTQDYAHMTNEEYAQHVGEKTAEVLKGYTANKVAGAAIPKLQQYFKAPLTLSTNQPAIAKVVEKFSKAEKIGPEAEVALPEGVSVKVPVQKTPVASMVMKSSAEKIVESVNKENISCKVVRDVKLEIKQRLDTNKHLTEHLNNKINVLAKNVNRERLGEGITINTPINIVEKIERDTAVFYSKMRVTTEDINAISKNTGISTHIIEKIKKHVFLEEHVLYDGIRKFDPQCDIAATWQRLIDNRFVYSDLVFLQHEYAESLVMNGLEISYNDAHSIINTIYNWEKEL